MNYNYFNQLMPQQQPVSSDDRIWVANQASAEAYLVVPNGFVRLWDNSSNKFYEKRADASGRPLPMDVFEYKKVSGPDNHMIDYSKRFDEIDAKLAELERRFNNEQSVSDDTDVSTVQ